MKKLVATLGRMAPLTLAALFVVLLLPLAGTQAPATHTAPAVTGTPLAAQAPIIGWSGPSILQPTVLAGNSCDDAVCNQLCIDMGGGLGFCRGNHCVCGL